MSRKIEDQMIAAIRAGKTFKSGNTEVRQPSDGATEVLLHGNSIIRYVPTQGWHWTLAGWNTATTRSRINAAVRGLNWDIGVCQKAGAPHAVKLGQVVPVADDEWVRVF
jgi:hypothetical protein